MEDKIKGLDEVKLDAEYNWKKRQRDEEEKRAYEASKRSEVQPSQQAPAKNEK